METINKIELSDPEIYPNEKILNNILGDSFEAYQSLLKMFEENEMLCEWRYYKDGKSWLCKVQKKKKTIVWMSAWKGYMQAVVYFPERLLHHILEADISESGKEKIRTTANVGKSRPCIFEVRGMEVLPDLEVVMNLKMTKK